jgi:hypothetical protein
VLDLEKKGIGMKAAGNYTMKRSWHNFVQRLFVPAMAVVLLLWGVPLARAGAIRYAGSEIAKGTNAAAMTATARGMSAADHIQSAAKATGGTLSHAAGEAGHGVVSFGKTAGDGASDGVAAVIQGAKSAPEVAARGTTTAAGAIWHAVW